MEEKKVIYQAPAKFVKRTKRELAELSNDAAQLYQNDKALKEHVDQLYSNDLYLARKHNSLCTAVGVSAVMASLFMIGVVIVGSYQQDKIDDISYENERLKRKIDRQDSKNDILEEEIKKFKKKVSDLEKEVEESKKEPIPDDVPDLDDILNS